MPMLFLIANITLRRYFAFLRTYSSPGQKARSRGSGVPTYFGQVTRKQLQGSTIPGAKGRGSTHNSSSHLPRQDLLLLTRPLWDPCVPIGNAWTIPYPILCSTNSSEMRKGNQILVHWLHFCFFFSPCLFSCCTTRWAKATPVRVLPLLQKTSKAGARLMSAGQGTSS